MENTTTAQCTDCKVTEVTSGDKIGTHIDLCAKCSSACTMQEERRWEIHRSENEDVYNGAEHYTIEEHTETSGTVIADIEGGLSDEACANAKLIAAAPLLLESLKICVKELRSSLKFPEVSVAVELAEQVIAQAQ